MNRWASWIFTIGALLSLTGCWNKYELTQWAFVQAVAIDPAEHNRVRLTTHFYKPGGGGGLEGTRRPTESFNIRTEGDNISVAISNISNELGRTAQWGHIRIILISDEMATHQKIKGIIDYFLRDHEPTETALVAITKGPAGDYLNRKPYIESTIGQQLREIIQSSKRFNGMTRELNLLQTAIALKSQTGIALLPYMVPARAESEPVTINGVAVFKNYSMIKPELPAESAKYVLMLRNEYERGVLAFPCEGDPANRKDTFEHVNVVSSTKIKIQKETVAVKLHVILTGGYGELQCSTVRSVSDEARVKQEIADMLEQEFRKTIALMQSRQLDLLNIGDAVYRQHPDVWRKWKSTWGKRLSEATFDYKIEIRMTNTGITKPNPYGS